ncbi:MAG: hypothetical protein AB1445_04670 [Bacillota bacterium]
MKMAALGVAWWLCLMGLAGCTGHGVTPAFRERQHPDHPGKTIVVQAEGLVRPSLSTALRPLLTAGLEMRLGICADALEGKSTGEVEELVGRLKDTVYAVSQVIASAHDQLNRYLWPDRQSRGVSLGKLKQGMAELERTWENVRFQLDELHDLPAVAALVRDVDRAFKEVSNSSLFNRKSLAIAHNIFHDLESIWLGTEPPPHGATETGSILSGQ